LSRRKGGFSDILSAGNKEKGRRFSRRENNGFFLLNSTGLIILFFKRPFLVVPRNRRDSAKEKLKKTEELSFINRMQTGGRSDAKV
jgi:hypothetical protein